MAGLLDIIPPENRPSGMVFKNIQGLLEVDFSNWRDNSNIQALIKKNPIVEKIIQAESSGNHRAFNEGSGARGLMQITPITALGGVDDDGNQTYAHGMYGRTLSLEELYDPEKNVKFGTDYFNALKKSFGNNAKALVAYNWGPGNYKEWREGGRNFSELPKETRDYLRKILEAPDKQIKKMLGVPVPTV